MHSHLARREVGSFIITLNSVSRAIILRKLGYKYVSLLNITGLQLSYSYSVYYWTNGVVKFTVALFKSE